MIIIMFLMALLASIFLEQNRHGQFPLFIERMLYIPLTVTAILLLNRIFRRLPHYINRCFSFVGGLSLEAYLIHIGFTLRYVEKLNLGYWPTFLLCTITTMPLAWLLNKSISLAINKITRGRKISEITPKLRK